MMKAASLASLILRDEKWTVEEMSTSHSCTGKPPKLAVPPPLDRPLRSTGKADRFPIHFSSLAGSGSSARRLRSHPAQPVTIGSDLLGDLKFLSIGSDWNRLSGGVAE